MAKPKTKTKPLSFRKTAKEIGTQLKKWDESRMAIDLSILVKKARDAAPNYWEADATELLASFHPTDDELEQMGLPRNFLKQSRCTNHTALFMADFTRFARFTYQRRAAKKKRKAPRAKK